MSYKSANIDCRSSFPIRCNYMYYSYYVEHLLSRNITAVDSLCLASYPSAAQLAIQLICHNTASLTPGTRLATPTLHLQDKVIASHKIR